MNEFIPTDLKVDNETGFLNDLNNLYTTLRNNLTVCNVKDYGAVGDGTTDDTAAIATCYTAARAVNGVVIFPIGTYINATAIDPLGTVTHGYGATLKHKPSVAAIRMFSGLGAYELHGLTIDMNKASVTDPASVTGHIAAYVPDTNGWTGVVRLIDCNFKNAWGPAVRLGATASSETNPDAAPAARAIVRGCTFDDVDYGIFAFGTTDSKFTDNTFVTVDHAAVYDYATLRSTIANNSVRAANQGILTQYSRQATITGNTVTLCDAQGIVVGGGTVTNVGASLWTISGNSVFDCDVGIQIDIVKTGALTTPVPAYGSVTGNICKDNTVHGIYVSYSSFVTIVGNTCDGNGNSGIRCVSVNCTIVGNVLTNNVNNLAFSGTTGTLGSHTVSGNQLSGAGTANLVATESNSVVNTAIVLTGTGSPEGVWVAPKGSTFARTDGGAGTCFYVKETGTGNTGWVAK